MDNPCRSPWPAVEEMAALIERVFAFDRRDRTWMAPGSLRVYFRSRDMMTKAGEIWPRLVVYPSHIQIRGFTWLVDLDYHTPTGEWSWWEAGDIPAEDMGDLKAIMDEGGLRDAYAKDVQRRREWPYRGHRLITGVPKPSKNKLHVDQLTAPVKKGRGKKVADGMTPEEVKHAWET